MTQLYQRKCQNWLASYRDWILPRIAAPESYVFWSGVYCISAAIRRKTFIGKSSLGTWECYPHCYVMLVGPPGFRKNTSMGPAIELLQDLSDVDLIRRGPNFITKESLLDSIFKSSDSSVYVTVEEFGDLLLKSGPEMYEFLTSLFDAKKHIDQSTLGRGYEFTEKPCFNLLAGTTPKWISEKMPESVIGGGFASRVLFIYEDREPPSKIFFKGVSDKFTELRKDLISDLSHIANNIEGEFSISEETQQWFEDWNRKMIKKKNTNPKLSGYYARKVTYIFKLAQIVHLSYSDELALSQLDFETAISMIESTEKTLPKVFAGVGKNEYSLDSKDIVEYIRSNPGVTKDRLLREFDTVASIDKLEMVIGGLLSMKYISCKLNDSKQLIFHYGEINDTIPKEVPDNSRAVE